MVNEFVLGDSENWTPAQAAWLTELSTKTVNATIDRGELARVSARQGEGVSTRFLASADVLYLALRKELSEFLSAKAKDELYQRVAELPSVGAEFWRFASRRADIVIPLADGLMLIEVKTTCRRLSNRWKALQEATLLVSTDPDIRGGEPVVKGTRVPVYLLADLVAQGAEQSELLEDYPALNLRKLRAALAYAETHPRRGRPRKLSGVNAARQSSGK